MIQRRTTKATCGPWPRDSAISRRFRDLAGDGVTCRAYFQGVRKNPFSCLPLILLRRRD